MPAPSPVKNAGLALTIAAALALVGYYSTVLLWKDIRPWRVYKVTAQKTGGLQKNDDVYVYGLLIGRVYSVQLHGDHQIVILQVDPAVTLYREGTKVEIESIDAFGNVAVFIDPGTPGVAYGPDDEVAGTFLEGFAAGPTEETGGRSRLSETLREVAGATDDLTRGDAGTIARLLNDPDLATEVRDGVARLHETAISTRAAARAIDTGEEGMTGLVSVDRGTQMVEASERIRGSLEQVEGGLRGAARGEVGLAGRLAGDESVRDSTRDALRALAGSLEGYRLGDPFSGPALFTSAPEPVEHLADSLQSLASETDAAVHAEGGLGGVFGPGTGVRARDAIANLERTLEGARSADPSAGTLLSPSVSGRRDVEDPVSRIEETLREMRGALVRIRAEQTPNTFQGAVFSVF